MSRLGVYSEVGKLRKVLVHRPDLSLKRLPPSYCGELLFDGVLWIRCAREVLRWSWSATCSPGP